MSTTLKVTPIPAFLDNYIWTLHAPLNPRRVAVVDPGDAQAVEAHLKQSGLTLCAILITHHHHDHTGGLLQLKQKYKVPVYGPATEKITGLDHTLAHGDHIHIEDLNMHFDILDLPGHTLGHIAYYGHAAVFCGDTLFSGGCGRMFEGTPEMFHHSLQTLAELPEDTAVYCTHEYTAANLRFAAYVEPDNTDIQAYQSYVTQKRANQQVTLPSTIALEKKINPFLHCADDLVQKNIARLSQHSFSDLHKNPVKTFACMRALKDNF
ncbi:MAG: hydroxyacylglutathione hydrolase [Gammaproteobacteria bacterium]|nr:hydroxyacylglutathione hydrolase [Gammaproteobacteria bacterium]NNC98330.1 hydroxyacylglutathione hydrolase [Gammaproteobacteria bacterium]NNM14411.1 hydroxyacylglutathione hydrolase [Gammaproteobacteria bacterium]